MLTCYDATFVHELSTAGVEIRLIGDTLGMILQGRNSQQAAVLIETAKKFEEAGAARHAWPEHHRQDAKIPGSGALLL
ncbi:hypothetical protein ACMYSN_06080 [Klebsiella sp. R445]